LDTPITSAWLTHAHVRLARLIALAAAFALALVMATLALPRPGDAAGAPAVYWGAYVQNGQNDNSLLDAFERNAGKHMSIVHWGQPWDNGGTFQEFHTQLFENIRERGSIPMITWGSWSVNHGPVQNDFRLSAITSGKYDAYIAEWARTAAAWGHPFFLRFDHEMNGNWQFPWAEQINGNNPGDYVRAWRHVHDIFTSVGATNATWVWCPNVSGSSTRPLDQLYPGDAYVDWTCLDGYNRTVDANDAWQSFAQVFGGSSFGGYNPHNSYRELLALAPSKPIMIGEVASTERGGSKANWITDMLGTQLPTNFPQIKALVWTEQRFEGLDWTIETSAASRSAFVNGIASSYYASNTFGSIGGGAIVPLADQVAVAPSSGGDVALAPVADTYTAWSNPDSAAGGSSQTLRADRSGTDTAFLRFDLSALAGKSITSASLRVHTTNLAWARSVADFDVKLVDSTDWDENWMSYRNPVPISPTVIGTLDVPNAPNTWYTVQIAPDALQAKVGSLLSVAVTGRSGDVVIFYSREAGAQLEPQLIVNYR
jgi:hypothetical protein